MTTWSPNAHPWPPTSRLPYPHWDHCTYNKGRGSAPGCDCGTEDQNDRLEAYWEGFDAGRGSVEPPDPTPPVGECPKCRHPWANHDTLMANLGNIMLPEYNPYKVADLYECDAYAGMGNWCGCLERSRLVHVPEGPDGALVPLPHKEHNS